MLCFKFGSGFNILGLYDMAKFTAEITFNGVDVTESSLKSIIVDSLEQSGYSKEEWQHEGEYFYGDFSIEVTEV